LMASRTLIVKVTPQTHICALKFICSLMHISTEENEGGGGGFGNVWKGGCV